MTTIITTTLMSTTLMTYEHSMIMAIRTKASVVTYTTLSIAVVIASSIAFVIGIAIWWRRCLAGSVTYEW